MEPLHGKSEPELVLQRIACTVLLLQFAQQQMS